MLIIIRIKNTQTKVVDKAKNKQEEIEKVKLNRRKAEKARIGRTNTTQHIHRAKITKQNTTKKNKNAEKQK